MGIYCLFPGLLDDNFVTQAKSCSLFLQSCSKIVLQADNDDNYDNDNFVAKSCS